MSIEFTRREDGAWQVATTLRGNELLSDGIINKGTAFTAEERRALGLEGLLPHHVSTLEEQVERAYGHVTEQAKPIDKYVVLAGLQERNETLFYRVLSDHIEALMPVVYTPTVGEATQKYSRIFRQARGLWLTPEHSGRMVEALKNAASEDVRLIVVTDNERILGLGDQGAGGMGIPIGTLALYTVAAGIHPRHTLPISLDVGTDNPALLEDPLYIGYRKPRLRGPDYHTLVNEFVEAVRTVFPKALLQWEDFKKQNAFDLLDRHRKALPSFNDDIEGTAGVALSGILAASRKSGVPFEKQRVVIMGAGAAGVGIGRLLRDAYARRGVTGDDLICSVGLLDSKGLLVEGREFGDAYKAELAWPAALAEAAGVKPGESNPEAIVAALKPTVLIGTTGRPGTFTEAMLRSIAKNTKEPAIFPFSNPTIMSEAHPKDILRWTEGRALIATGSPFGTVDYDGRAVRIGQGNNVYIFPGVGLGVLVSEAKEVVPSMFTVAAEILAAEVSAADLAEGSLFPRLSRLRDVTRKIGRAVAEEAIAQGVSDMAVGDLEGAFADFVWAPSYPSVVPA